MSTDPGNIVTIRVPAQLMDEAEYAKAMKLPRRHEPDSHPCEIMGCAISQEEHHRIAFGYMRELKILRDRVARLENG